MLEFTVENNPGFLHDGIDSVSFPLLLSNNENVEISRCQL